MTQFAMRTTIATLITMKTKHVLVKMVEHTTF